MHDVDDGTLRKHCRTWLDAATKPEVRDRVLGQLARQTSFWKRSYQACAGRRVARIAGGRMELEMDQWPPPGVGSATARSVLRKNRRP